MHVLILVCAVQLLWFNTAQKTADLVDASMPNGADILRREKKAKPKQPASLLTSSTSRYRHTKKAIYALEKQVKQNQERAMDLQKLMQSITMKDLTSASLIEEAAGSNEEKATRNFLDRIAKLNQTATDSPCHAFQEDAITNVLHLTKGRSFLIRHTGQGFGGNLVVGEGHSFAGKCKNSFVAGFSNKCNGDSQVMLGGMNNQVGHTKLGEQDHNLGQVVMGGASNKALKNYASVVGGYGNEVESQYGAILGGFNGKIKCLTQSFRPVLIGGTEVIVDKDTWVAPDSPCKHS